MCKSFCFRCGLCGAPKTREAPMNNSKEPTTVSVDGRLDRPSSYVEAPANAAFRDSPFVTANRFAKLKKVPAYRMLAEAITEQILDGRMRAGEQLPTEAQLCSQFGVNRSTVREGTRVIEEANLLRRESAKRLLVSRPSREEIGNLLERALLLHEI